MLGLSIGRHFGEKDRKLIISLCEDCGANVEHDSNNKVVDLFTCPYCGGSLNNSYRYRTSVAAENAEDEVVLQIIEEREKLRESLKAHISD